MDSGAPEKVSAVPSWPVCNCRANIQ